MRAQQAFVHVRRQARRSRRRRRTSPTATTIRRRRSPPYYRRCLSLWMSRRTSRRRRRSVVQPAAQRCARTNQLSVWAGKCEGTANGGKGIPLSCAACPHTSATARSMGAVQSSGSGTAHGHTRIVAGNRAARAGACVGDRRHAAKGRRQRSARGRSATHGAGECPASCYRILYMGSGQELSYQKMLCRRRSTAQTLSPRVRMHRRTRRRQSRSSQRCSQRCLRRPSPTRSAALAATCRMPWMRCFRRRRSARGSIPATLLPRASIGTRGQERPGLRAVGERSARRRSVGPQRHTARL